jgi:hypothetical protein
MRGKPKSTTTSTSEGTGPASQVVRHRRASDQQGAAGTSQRLNLGPRRLPTFWCHVRLLRDVGLVEAQKVACRSESNHRRPGLPGTSPHRRFFVLHGHRVRIVWAVLRRQYIDIQKQTGQAQAGF